MRRTLAVLALVATSWPHAVVLECALGSTSVPSGAVPAHHGAGHSDAHHGSPGHHGSHLAAGGAAGAVGDQGTPSGGAACAMAMACGLTMLKAAGDALASPGVGTPDAAPAASLLPPAPAELTGEAPPPRRNA